MKMEVILRHNTFGKLDYWKIVSNLAQWILGKCVVEWVNFEKAAGKLAEDINWRTRWTSLDVFRNGTWIETRLPVTIKAVLNDDSRI